MGKMSQRPTLKVVYYQLTYPYLCLLASCFMLNLKCYETVLALNVILLLHSHWATSFETTLCKFICYIFYIVLSNYKKYQKYCAESYGIL